jgi:hypothetical protein
MTTDRAPSPHRPTEAVVCSCSSTNPHQDLITFTTSPISMYPTSTWLSAFAGTRLPCTFIMFTLLSQTEPARHILHPFLGIPMDRQLDSAGDYSNHHVGRTECTAWLQSLRVIDAWRIHHPLERVYSSPRRVNRIDYIFVDMVTTCETYKDVKYFPSEHIAEHLCHSVSLQPRDVPLGQGYWKLPKELLLLPEVANTIIAEAKAILPILQHANNWGSLGGLEETHSDIPSEILCQAPCHDHIDPCTPILSSWRPPSLCCDTLHNIYA